MHILKHRIKAVPQIPNNAKVTARNDNPYDWVADAYIDGVHHRWRFVRKKLIAHCTYNSEGEFQGYDWHRRTKRAGDQ